MHGIPKPHPGASQYEWWHYQELVRQQERAELIDALTRWNNADTIEGRLCEKWPKVYGLLESCGITPSASTQQWLPIFCALWKRLADNPILTPTASDLIAFLYLKRGIRPEQILAASLEQACQWLQDILNDAAESNSDSSEKAASVERPKIPDPAPERGVGGGNEIKLVAALTQHHRYADGSCLNQTPIGNNELAKKACVSNGTASNFFKEKFGGHDKYKQQCGNRQTLITALKMLNSEFVPSVLLSDAAKSVVATEEGPRVARPSRSAGPRDDENDR